MLPMLRLAGLGVAMGNAPEAVKTEAKAVTKSTMSTGSRKLSKSMFYYKAKNLLKGRFFIDDNHKLGEDCRLPRK